ncbi:hypothetical protein F2P56_011731 [Juglans regia]|uniref:Uncharacterized protein n=1 Tax=Juglans regia TaxID=51240 RepID=A0A834D0R2_JUGRE|nr:hypothetical protein F2P56_011731 [Juglans regia]
MGQEIVRRECHEEPGRRSRLCGLEDVFHVLKNDTGSDAIKGIVMDFCPETKEIRINAKALSKMRKLRFFKFHESQTIKWRGKPLKYMPTNELRFLEWSGYASRSWPSSFQPNNLTILRMYNSRMKQLWKGSMVFYNLKVLDVSGSEDLIKTPDLTGAPNLEKLDFSGCRSLCELHPSIEAIKGLEELRMSGSRIKELWKGLVVFENLKVLDVSDSKNLIKTPDLTGAPLLENLNLSGCRSLCEVHPSIGSLKRLKELWLNKCSGLKKLPDLSRLECLTDLWALETALTQIPSLDLIPKSIREFHLEVREYNSVDHGPINCTNASLRTSKRT